MVRANVVQIGADVSWKKDLCLARLGDGTAIRAPDVWLKRTQSSPTLGRDRIRGKLTAGKTTSLNPSRTLVTPVKARPSCPQATTLPCLTSIQARSRLTPGKEWAPCSWSSASQTGCGGVSGRTEPTSTASRGTASGGIHDTQVTKDSMRSVRSGVG
jgi:hypothetical protein